jgi:hypothetical protein
VDMNLFDFFVSFSEDVVFVLKNGDIWLTCGTFSSLFLALEFLITHIKELTVNDEVRKGEMRENEGEKMIFLFPQKIQVRSQPILSSKRHLNYQQWEREEDEMWKLIKW